MSTTDKGSAIAAALLLVAPAIHMPEPIPAPGPPVTVQAPRRHDDLHIDESADTAPLPAPQVAEVNANMVITPGTGALNFAGELPTLEVTPTLSA